MSCPLSRFICAPLSREKSSINLPCFWGVFRTDCCWASPSFPPFRVEETRFWGIVLYYILPLRNKGLFYLNFSFSFRARFLLSDSQAPISDVFWLAQKCQLNTFSLSWGFGEGLSPPFSFAKSLYWMVVSRGYSYSLLFRFLVWWPPCLHVLDLKAE